MTTIYDADARDLNMLIRRKKKTREEICFAYNCTAEEFEGVLKRVYTSAKAFKEIGRVLENNARDAKRTKKSRSEDDSNPEPNLEATEVPSEPEPDEMEVLVHEKTMLEQEIIPLEQSYQEDIGARRRILQEARDIKAEIEKLREMAKNLMDEKYVPLMERNNDLVAIINRKGAVIREKRARYDAISTRIAELENVCVLVCDGMFESDPEIKLDFSGWEAIYAKLLQSEDAVFDLKKSQLKTVAESVAAGSNSSRTLVFEFDSRELEDAYAVAVGA